MKKLIYIYDAYCPWCYAFTPVVRQVYDEFRERLELEIISGGMIVDDQLKTIGGLTAAEHLKSSYQQITERTGAQFGEAFFHRIKDHQTLMNSEIPARALAVFRELETETAPLEFVHKLIYSLFNEGKDPNEERFYRDLAAQFQLDADQFVMSMKDEYYQQLARYDFSLAKQLQATSFPRLFLQTSETYFHLVSKGYSDYSQVSRIVTDILSE